MDTERQKEQALLNQAITEAIYGLQSALAGIDAVMDRSGITSPRHIHRAAVVSALDWFRQERAMLLAISQKR